MLFYYYRMVLTDGIWMLCIPHQQQQQQQQQHDVVFLLYTADVQHIRIMVERFEVSQVVGEDA